MEWPVVGAILVGVLLIFLAPLSSPRHSPFFLAAVGALMIVSAGWVYCQQFDEPDPFACTEADGKAVCTFKGKPHKPQGSKEYVCEKVDGNMLCEQLTGTTIRHKGKAYILHHFDGKDVYLAE